MELLDLLELLSWAKSPAGVWLIVGLFIGWNLPQPSWAKLLQDKVVMLVKTLVAKLKKD